MAQYAEACCVSASTLSRIATAKINSAISGDLIVALHENQDAETEISLDTWMCTNGMRRKADREREDIHYQRMQRMRERRDREIRRERAVTNSLTDRGVMLQKTPRQFVRHIAETSSSVFLLDAWDPEMLENEKFLLFFQMRTL